MKDIKEVGYYTLKEIIFGLRKEYLKNVNDLDSLKPLCFASKSKINDYRFEIFQLNFKSPDLYCVVNKKKKLLERLTFVDCDNIYNTAICLKNGSDYLLYSNQKNVFPVVISHINQDDFKSRSYRILHSDFTKKIKTKSISFWALDMVGFFKCEHNYLNFQLFFDALYDDDSKRINILYYPREDVILIEGVKDLLEEVYNVNDKADSNIVFNDELIERLLNVRVSKEVVPRYHRDLIENMSDTSKNVIVEGIGNDFSLVNLQIKDADFFTILTPIKLCKDIRKNRKILDDMLEKQKILSVKK